MSLIQNHTQLRHAISHLFGSNRDFILAFESEGGQIDETVLSRQLSGTRGLSSAWLSAYNIFFLYFVRDLIADRAAVSRWIYDFDCVSGGVFFSSDHQEAKQYIETTFPGKWNGEAYFINF